MNAPRPRVQIAIVCAGLVAAPVVGSVSVYVRHWLLPLPPEESNGGMAAFGDLLQVIAVSGLVALWPLAHALYWLRAVERFWTALQWGATIFAATGWLALLGFVVARRSTSGWLLFALARIGLMPLSALAGATCALFAPHARQRGWLVASALSEVLLFLSYLFVSGALASLLGH